jgi:hypothetical protein
VDLADKEAKKEGKKKSEEEINKVSKLELVCSSIKSS